ncbi:MAG: hypothetical protein GY934_09375 [Gammaproteobacteria bacterium]|nr:hypothetical protein [Gammaproteobacteria bacterium]
MDPDPEEIAADLRRYLQHVLLSTAPEIGSTPIRSRIPLYDRGLVNNRREPHLTPAVRNA